MGKSDKEMTREQFISEQAKSERRIRRRCAPLGIIYCIRLATGGFGLYLLAICFKYFNTDARSTILWELAACISIIAITFPWERYSKHRFVELATKCPSCQSILVFLHDEKNVNSGRCYNCGQLLFEIGAEPSGGGDGRPAAGVPSAHP